MVMKKIRRLINIFCHGNRYDDRIVLYSLYDEVLFEPGLGDTLIIKRDSKNFFRLTRDNVISFKNNFYKITGIFKGEVNKISLKKVPVSRIKPIVVT